jgi:hypothetical protein
MEQGGDSSRAERTVDTGNPVLYSRWSFLFLFTWRLCCRDICSQLTTVLYETATFRTGRRKFQVTSAAANASAGASKFGRHCPFTVFSETSSNFSMIHFLCPGDCELPESWSGGWFESGVRDGVNISSSLLTHKGNLIRTLS